MIERPITDQDVASIRASIDQFICVVRDEGVNDFWGLFDIVGEQTRYADSIAPDGGKLGTQLVMTFLLQGLLSATAPA
jgi:hypothetical protein